MDVNDNNALKAVELSTQKVQIATRTTAHVKPGVTALDGTKARHHVAARHEHLFANRVVPLRLRRVKGRHFLSVAGVELSAGRQWMKDHFRGCLQLAGEVGLLTAGRFWIYKGKGVTRHEAGESARVHFDAILGIKLGAQIGNVQIIEEGLVVHFHKC